MSARILIIISVLGLVAACSQEEGNSIGFKGKSSSPTKSGVAMPSTAAVLPPEVARAVATLNNEPDYQLKVKALTELRNTNSDAACLEMVKHLQYQFGQLPPALRRDDGYDEATFSRLGYISRLLEEIRKMNLPLGNKATAEILETMRKRYVGQPLGNQWIDIYEGCLRNVVKDIEMGLYQSNPTSPSSNP